MRRRSPLANGARRPDDDHGTGRWVRATDVLWRDGLDRVVLLPPGVDEPVVLTGPGQPLWHLLETPVETGEVVRSLAALYGTPAAEVVEPVLAVLDELAGCDAVRRVL